MIRSVRPGPITASRAPFRKGESLAVALALALGCAACGDSAYRGAWEVVGYKRSQLSSFGNPEAEMWLGAPYDLSSKQAAAAGDTCDVAKAQRQTLSVFDVEMSYNLVKGDLGISQPEVELLDLQCSAGSIPWGQQLIRLGPDSLLTPWNGGIFLLLGKRRGTG